MSQTIRDYDLRRVDENTNEATRMSVTATVGPTPTDEGGSRGVQLTLDTPDGTTYARVSEAQIRDLMQVLDIRVDDGDKYEATGWEAEREMVAPDGAVE